MKKYILKFKNSVFGKTIFTFTLIILPIFVLCLTVYFYGLSLVKKEISSSLMMNNKYTISNIENEIRKINKLIYGYLEDRDLNVLTNIPLTDAFTQYQAMIRLQDKLISSKDSSEYLLDVTTYILPLEYSLSAMQYMAKLNLDDYNKMWNTDKKSGAGIINYDNQLHIFAIKKFYIEGKLQQPLLIIDAKISKDAILQKLKICATENDSEIIFTNSNQDINFIVNNQDDSSMPSYILNIVNQNIKKSNEDVIFHTYKDKTIVITYIYSEYLDMTLIQYVTNNIYLNNLLNYKQILTFLIALTISMVILFSFLIFRIIQKPVRLLINGIQKVEQGELNYIIEYEKKDDFKYLINGFNHMVIHLEQLINQVYKQEILTKRAELKQLQAQIDPHFLFNSFFMVKTMINSEKYNDAEDFIQHLGDYFKYIAENNNDYNSLNDEFYHVKTYSNIQVMRFKRHLKIIIYDLDENIKNVIVPRLIIQPLIENAVEHAVKQNIRLGIIEVYSNQRDNIVEITVKDNGEKSNLKTVNKLNSMLDDNNEHISAIVNIHRRIRIMYGENSYLRFELDSKAGIKAIITLDLLKNENQGG